MALFPRKLRGYHYAMLSRQDGENIHLMYSTIRTFGIAPTSSRAPSSPGNLSRWATAARPSNPGGMARTQPRRRAHAKVLPWARSSSISNNPRKCSAACASRFLVPLEEERTGYLPNVVYTCGGLVHGGSWFFPYAVSDYATRFCSIELSDLLGAME